MLSPEEELLKTLNDISNLKFFLKKYNEYWVEFKKSGVVDSGADNDEQFFYRTIVRGRRELDDTKIPPRKILQSYFDETPDVLQHLVTAFKTYIEITNPLPQVIDGLDPIENEETRIKRLSNRLNWTSSEIHAEIKLNDMRMLNIQKWSIAAVEYFIRNNDYTERARFLEWFITNLEIEEQNRIVLLRKLGNTNVGYTMSEMQDRLQQAKFTMDQAARERSYFQKENYEASNQLEKLKERQIIAMKAIQKYISEYKAPVYTESDLGILNELELDIKKLRFELKKLQKDFPPSREKIRNKRILIAKNKETRKQLLEKYEEKRKMPPENLNIYRQMRYEYSLLSDEIINQTKLVKAQVKKLKILDKQLQKYENEFHERQGDLDNGWDQMDREPWVEQAIGRMARQIKRVAKNEPLKSKTMELLERLYRRKDQSYFVWRTRRIADFIAAQERELTNRERAESKKSDGTKRMKSTFEARKREREQLQTEKREERNANAKKEMERNKRKQAKREGQNAVEVDKYELFDNTTTVTEVEKIYKYYSKQYDLFSNDTKFMILWNKMDIDLQDPKSYKNEDKLDEFKKEFQKLAESDAKYVIEKFGDDADDKNKDKFKYKDYNVGNGNPTDEEKLDFLNEAKKIYNKYRGNGYIENEFQNYNIDPENITIDDMNDTALIWNLREAVKAIREANYKYGKFYLKFRYLVNRFSGIPEFDAVTTDLNLDFDDKAQMGNQEDLDKLNVVKYLIQKRAKTKGAFYLDYVRLKNIYKDNIAIMNILNPIDLDMFDEMNDPDLYGEIQMDIAQILQSDDRLSKDQFITMLNVAYDLYFKNEIFQNYWRYRLKLPEKLPLPEDVTQKYVDGFGLGQNSFKRFNVLVERIYTIQNDDPMLPNDSKESKGSKEYNYYPTESSEDEDNPMKLYEDESYQDDDEYGVKPMETFEEEEEEEEEENNLKQIVKALYAEKEKKRRQKSNAIFDDLLKTFNPQEQFDTQYNNSPDPFELEQQQPRLRRLTPADLQRRETILEERKAEVKRLLEQGELEREAEREADIRQQRKQNATYFMKNVDELNKQKEIYKGKPLTDEEKLATFREYKERVQQSRFERGEPPIDFEEFLKRDPFPE